MKNRVLFTNLKKSRRRPALQVPPKIHMLMKGPYDKDTIPGLAVKYRMARGFDLAIAWPDIARVASKIGKFRQHSERFVQPQNVFFRAVKAPSSQEGFGDGIDVGVGFR